jgi:O-antigen biosynthesis protein
MPSKTYVVMPNYIVTDELLELAINSVKSFKENSDAIVITVDDGSPMDISGLIGISDYYIRNKENSGFGISCNNGFKKVFEIEKEDCYIICANNDIEINKKVVPALKEPFELYDNVAITGVVTYKDKIVDGKTLEHQYFDEIVQGGVLRGWMQDGGLWMSKKSVLEKIGLFDEQYIRGGYEDIDLFLRAKDTFGMKIVMSGHAAYWHKQGATRWNCEQNGFINNFGVESKNIEGENLVRFINKWKVNPHLGQIWTPKAIN